MLPDDVTILVSMMAQLMSSAKVLRSLVNPLCKFSQEVRPFATSVPRLINVSVSDEYGHKLSPNPFDLVSYPPSKALSSLSEEELAFKESAARYAKERIEPLVKSMDQSGVMDPNVIKGLFDNGVSI